MYFLKIKLIFGNEAFPVFHYQQVDNPQPQIISTFLSLLIPAEVVYNFHLKANTTHTQDQSARRCLNAAPSSGEYVCGTWDAGFLRG